MLPPPVVYVAGFLLGLAAGKLWRIAFAIPPRVGLLVGLFCMLFWIGLWVSAVPRFARAKTAISTHRPVTSLITSGIYSRTRNPLYIGWTCLYVGVAMLLQAWWCMVMLIPVAMVIDRGIVRKEEEYLRDKFGEEYLQYKSRVRRWL
jgi:protein-S-isoprenylcysteine O-methyltransferase Ste14